MNEFPIQIVKVQRPPLRAATLQRDRLLDWLHVQIHHRIVLVTAEAGYGKTTLLSDFARRSRIRTLWYRLDDEDRNWVSFLNYLVAAGREADPGFAPTTFALLAELGTVGPSRELIIESFLRELPALVDEGPAALIFDDYHLVDDAPDVNMVMRAMLDRTPERLSLVFSSRRQSTLPMARIRALGELAELATDDLRFDATETEKLFRESYGRPLEADVLEDLRRRTEGWVASLQLLQTALRSRTAGEVRAFVRSLNGAQADLYDYLAEEVVGDLDEPMQRFLMRTCVLQVVDPTLTSLLTGYDSSESKRLMAGAEHLGLLARRGETTRDQLRYHPLVRDFLEARLRRDSGDEIVPTLHRQVGVFAETRNWALSAHHFAAAEAHPELHRVLTNSVQTIMGRGEFALAESYIDRLQSESRRPEFDIVRSRMELQRGYLPAAIARANAAYASLPENDTGHLRALATANLTTVSWLAGDVDQVQTLNDRLIAMAAPSAIDVIARATQAIFLASDDLPLDEPRSILKEAERLHRAEGHGHYLGITLLNLAHLDFGAGAVLDAVEHSAEATESLAATSAGLEVGISRTIRALALAHLGRWNEATDEMTQALAAPFVLARAEVLGEVAMVYGSYDDPERADQFFHEAVQSLPGADIRDTMTVQWARNEVRLGHPSAAAQLLASVVPNRLHGEVLFKTKMLVAQAELSLQVDPDDPRPASDALALAASQGAHHWVTVAQFIAAAQGNAVALNALTSMFLRLDPSHVSIAAEAIAMRLHWLDEQTFGDLRVEVVKRGSRWRPAIRRTVTATDHPGRYRAAMLLDEIGCAEDVRLLRSVGRQIRSTPGAPPLGHRLARRLAQRVWIEDQGRVRIVIGERVVPGTDVRRKVLALLCFMVSKIDMSATRDQVLEALWPDSEPDTAMNSLNQTVYFLRRVFEPNYKEDVSAGYLHH
ncbi:MAG TPA: AAA family ATPase, partial [Candidatus Saccharimonadales bacterium]|nr:AAA family ATPase [Candidatus Saccharimonadales bacterium]